MAKARMTNPLPTRPASAAVERPKCVHLRAPTGELRDCGACKGRVQIKVFECGVFGTCTLATALPGMACCSGGDCPKYAAFLPSQSPWDYPVSICIPHLDTPQPIELAVSLWRLQTIKPYFLIVDTGSTPENLARVQALRGPDCEVLSLPCGEFRHPSCIVSLALDLAHGRCQTPYLFQTHTDVFPVARNLLEWMRGQTSEATPVVGWRMSPRTTGPWAECVSHTATMVHTQTWRTRRLAWNLDMYLDTHPDEAHLFGGWPDTESGLWWTMMREGMRPKFVGDDLNHERLKNEWFDHSRSYTCIRRHGADGPQSTRAERDMCAAETEARARLKEWSSAWGL